MLQIALAALQIGDVAIDLKNPNCIAIRVTLHNKAAVEGPSCPIFPQMLEFAIPATIASQALVNFRDRDRTIRIQQRVRDSPNRLCARFQL